MLYPIALDLEGKRCLVVGGGAVGERKVRGLLECNASVSVVSPEVTPWLAAEAASGRICHEAREFDPVDVQGAALVYAASDSMLVNAVVAEAAREVGILVNRADTPDGGDFQVPALIREDGLFVAVGSGGVPALSAWLRDRVREGLPRGLGPLALLLGAVRDVLGPGVGRDAWNDLLNSGVDRDVLEGDMDSVGRKVDRAFGEGTWEKTGKGAGNR